MGRGTREGVLSDADDATNLVDLTVQLDGYNSQRKDEKQKIKDLDSEVRLIWGRERWGGMGRCAGDDLSNAEDATNLADLTVQLDGYKRETEN